MSVKVNDQDLAPRQKFSGGGPFIIQGAATIPKGALLHLQFVGPKTQIPNLVSPQTTDARSLGFSLFAVSITARCDRP
jgi:hypothetical protein